MYHFSKAMCPFALGVLYCEYKALGFSQFYFQNSWYWERLSEELNMGDKKLEDSICNSLEE